MNSLIDFAVFSAEVLYEAGKLHESVNQFYDEARGLPYQYHLDLALQFAKLGFSDVPGITPREIKIITFATVFHDAIEDTRETYNDILRRALRYFEYTDAKTATDIVYAVTNEKGKTRAERANDAYYTGITSTPYAPYVKVCDRLANMAYSMAQDNIHMKAVYKEELGHFINSVCCSETWPFCVPDNLLNMLKGYGE